MGPVGQEGGASLRMWARLVDQEFWSKGEEDHQVAGTTNWAEYEIPFVFQKGQLVNRLQVGLRLGGKGTIWIKDVELVRQPLLPLGIPQKKAREKGMTRYNDIIPRSRAWA